MARLRVFKVLTGPELFKVLGGLVENEELLVPWFANERDGSAGKQRQKLIVGYKFDFGGLDRDNLLWVRITTRWASN